MKRAIPICVGPMLAVLACQLAVAAEPAAENLNIAHVRPEAVIPFMAKAPKIDGVIEDGEWNTLHVSRFVSQGNDQLQPRPGEFWIGCDGRKIYMAVRSAVHPTAGVLAKIEKGSGGKDQSDAVMDDSIELWFNNDPSGKSGEYYQVLLNSNGAIYDSEFENADQIAKTYWRVDMEQAHKVEGGVWTAEFAVDLKSIKVADPTKPLAVRVCRNYKWPWNQSRWAPMVIAFASPETMPRVKFADGAPIVSEIGFQDAAGIDVAVDVSNPTDKPMSLKVKLGYNAENQPRYYQDAAAELKPGEKRRFEYKKEFFTPENYPALAEILVSGADGAVFYHRDAKWQTKPKEPIWDPVGAVSAEEATRFDIEFHPTPKILRWRASFPNMKDKEKIRQMRLSVVDQKSGRQVADQVAGELKAFAAERQLALAALPDGRYEARLFLDAEAPALEAIKTNVFEYISSFPWLNNKIGISDAVIPPFTPLTVKDETVGAVLREHAMTDAGLWKQVVADGREILAGPMTLEVRQGGKIHPAKGALRFTVQKPNAVTAHSAWKAGSVAGTTTSEYDYDGCMKVTLEFAAAPAGAGQPAPVDGMRLAIPLRDKLAPLMHACGDGIRFNYGGVVPPGQGAVWTSAKASRNQVLGTFLPYVWVGGEERGLCWFAASDKDWVVDPKDQVPALALERRDGVLTLCVNLVQAPDPLSRPRRIVFGLQATPTRPMPAQPNWRTWGCVSGGKFDATVMGMCTYWGGSLYSVFPNDRDFTIVRKIADAMKGGPVDRPYFDAYIKKYGNGPEINWSANARKSQAAIPYTNIRGEITSTPEWVVYQNEWQKSSYPARQTVVGQGGGIDFSTIATPSRRDFFLYYYREFLTNGFDGIYWDNIYISANENPITSDGYLRADGAYQPGCDIWEIREVAKRTAVLAHEVGKVNVNMPHMTNAQLVPVFTWTGFGLDWEWKYGAADFQDRFKTDYIRAATIGQRCGLVTVVLDGIREVPDPKTIPWIQRTRIAVCVPHELKVWQADKLLIDLTQKMFELGYGTDDCQVYHYWDEQPVARVEGMDTAWIVLNGKSAVMLLVGDYGNGGAAKVTLDTAKLGLPADFKAVNWENPKDEAPAARGAIELKDFKKHDFRAMLIPKKNEP